MPTVKCGGCAKYLSAHEAAKCYKCSTVYHRACAGLPIKSIIALKWHCPDCMKGIKSDIRSQTPMRVEEEIIQATDASINPNEFICTPPDSVECFPTDFIEQLRIFKEELLAEFRLLRQELQETHSEISLLKDSLRSCNDRMNGLEARVGELEHKIEQEPTRSEPMDLSQLEHTISELKCQLNERDQELLLNDVEVSGIPELKNESALHLVKFIAVKLGVAVGESDIVHVERIGSSRRNRVASADGTSSGDVAMQQPRNISVTFARRATRDAMLRAARVRRGLSTSDLEMDGSARRVYVNERLTRLNRHLFYHARQTSNLRKWKYVWTREGRIFARRDDGCKVERIRSLDDINQIFS